MFRGLDMICTAQILQIIYNTNIMTDMGYVRSINTSRELSDVWTNVKKSGDYSYSIGQAKQPGPMEVVTTAVVVPR